MAQHIKHIGNAIAGAFGSTCAWISAHHLIINEAASQFSLWGGCVVVCLSLYNGVQEWRRNHSTKNPGFPSSTTSKPRLLLPPLSTRYTSHGRTSKWPTPPPLLTAAYS